MTHPLEEQLIDAYYADTACDVKRHLETCSVCSAKYRDLASVLDAVTFQPQLPRRDNSYPSVVWARLQPKLPDQPSAVRWRSWLLIPAAAAILIALLPLIATIKQTKPTQTLPVASFKPPSAPDLIAMQQLPTRKPTWKLPPLVHHLPPQSSHPLAVQQWVPTDLRRLNKLDQFTATPHQVEASALSYAVPNIQNPLRIDVEAAEANLITRIEPEYPAQAKSAQVEGEVEFSAIIGADGDIKTLRLLRGHPLLAPAARNAVLQWKYKPILLNGQPTAVVAPVNVSFRLTN